MKFLIFALTLMISSFSLANPLTAFFGISLNKRASIVTVGSTRYWSDGTYANSCLGYYNSGKGNYPYKGSVGDGIYRIKTSTSTILDVYCQMTTNGGGWTRVLNQNINTGGLFTSSTVLSSNVSLASSSTLYSILSQLENFKRNEKFELMLNWPGFSPINIWRQTNNFTTGTANGGVSGYESISIGASNNPGAGSNTVFGGLEYNGSLSLADGSLNHVNWFFAVGAYTTWVGGIPGYSASSSFPHIELWVR